MSSNGAVASQRAWARVAGLMYWVVLMVDITGMQLPSRSLGQSLAVAGSVFTVPLALGLYFALRPAGPALAASGLAFRLLEAALGFLSSVTGFAIVRDGLARSTAGTALLGIARWDDSTAFAAFVFTVGSTIFFYLFVRSRYIPPVLAWWGLFASVVALLACATHLVRPAFPAMTMLPWIPALLAETSTGLWLLTKSVNPRGRELETVHNRVSAN